METVRRALAWEQARVVETQVRERILERVEVLVQGMEATARRIASERTGVMRRSVLVARFNDLRRQVNRIDGIVGSEGREGGAPMVAASDEASGEAAALLGGGSPEGQAHAMRQRLQAEWSRLEAGRRQGRQRVETELDRVSPGELAPIPVEVESLAGAIRAQRSSAVAVAANGRLLDLQA